MRYFKNREELKELLKRTPMQNEQICASVKKVLADVKAEGDAALIRYTEMFDQVTLTSQQLQVTPEEIEAAYKSVSPEQLNALKNAKENILSYNMRLIRSDNLYRYDGKTTGYIVRSVKRAGIYVPGGKAAYPSSVLMCALPAVAAGVEEIVMTTPCVKSLNPLTLVAADLCGISKIFKLGGAQAIAAMAYGTQSVAKVDVIAGPGNVYVAMAKREVYGEVNIDMIAGPSEIVILADTSANPRFVAADLLSQAEHDEMAMCILVTTDAHFAERVNKEVKRQLQLLPKKEIAEASLQNYGGILITDSIEEGIDAVNLIAPEHFELCVENASALLPLIKNAGAVFMGNYSPEPLGDYYAGPNHVLPTSGTSRFFSSLGVDNYIKKISVIDYSEEALAFAKNDILTLAEAEGLRAHANAVRVRFEKDKEEE